MSNTANGHAGAVTARSVAERRYLYATSSPPLRHGLLCQGVPRRSPCVQSRGRTAGNGAQSSQAQVVRASAFELVGADGTVLARLAPNSSMANGNLTLYDAAGMERLVLAGGGAVIVFDQEGTTPVFRAGRTLQVGPSGPPGQWRGARSGRVDRHHSGFPKSRSNSELI